MVSAGRTFPAADSAIALWRPRTVAPLTRAGVGSQPEERHSELRHCRFQQGDASNLSGVADHSFDLVLTMFGAMFAPRPFDVAREMVRVTRPGGRIVMGNWIPNDPTLVTQILRISSAYSPPPPEGFIRAPPSCIASSLYRSFAVVGCNRRTRCHRTGEGVRFLASH